MAEFFGEVMDSSLYLVLFGDVGCCGDGAFWVLLLEFIQQVCSSPSDTYTVSVGCIFLKQGLANAEVAPIMMIFIELFLFVLLGQSVLPFVLNWPYVV